VCKYLSHGGLVEALISSVQFIVGNLHQVKGISVWSKDRTEEVRDRIKKGLNEVNDGDGVVILTDIFGGTPTNLSLSFLEDEKVTVLIQISSVRDAFGITKPSFSDLAIIVGFGLVVFAIIEVTKIILRRRVVVGRRITA